MLLAGSCASVGPGELFSNGNHAATEQFIRPVYFKQYRAGENGWCHLPKQKECFNNIKHAETAQGVFGIRPYTATIAFTGAISLSYLFFQNNAFIRRADQGSDSSSILFSSADKESRSQGTI